MQENLENAEKHRSMKKLTHSCQRKIIPESLKVKGRLYSRLLQYQERE